MTAPRLTDEAAPAKHPTWRDLMPSALPTPRLITREELLDQFRETPKPITERTLRYWESIGVVPRPVRQWHGDAVHAVYPHWFGIIVATVAKERELGTPLPELAAHMPGFLQWLATLHWSEEHRIYPIPAKLVPDIEELTRIMEEHHPERVAYATVDLYDAQGQRVSRFLYPRQPGAPTDSNSPE